MTETILRLLTRLSEAGGDAILPGELASPFLGPVFERLLAKRVLVEQAPLADWDVCDACECGLPCRPIRKSSAGFRAECPLDRLQDVELTEQDLRQYRVDATGLATAIAIAAGFAKLPEQVAEGIWLLGNLESGRAVFLALHAAALEGEMIVTALREGAQGDDITILTPPLAVAGAMRLRDAGCYLVETLSVVAPATGGVGATIDPLVLSPTPSIPMLRVRVGAGQVLCGNRSVILSRQIFPVFKRLLDKAVSRDPVASGSHVEGTTLREAKDLIRELRDGFKAVGFTDAEAKSLIASVRNRGYRLGVSASDIIVED